MTPVLIVLKVIFKIELDFRLFVENKNVYCNAKKMLLITLV